MTTDGFTIVQANCIKVQLYVFPWAVLPGRHIIRTVVRIVGMGRMSHICNTKCSRL